MTNLLSTDCALKLRQLLVLLSMFSMTSVLSSCGATSQFSDAAPPVAGAVENSSTEETAIDESSTAENAETALPPTPEQETIETIAKIEPSLAVRATSCLLCHAQVKGAIMTDLGGGEKTSSIYLGGQTAMSWSSMNLNGKVIVPKKKIANTWIRELVEGLVATSNPVEEVTTLKIKYPSAALIRASAQLSGAISAKGLPSGITQQSNGFVEISGNLNCSGDIAISGFLHLKSLSLTTTNGCRIYVTGNIFVSGGIKQTGGALRNIQLVSASGIYLEMDSGDISARATHMKGQGQDSSFDNLLTTAVQQAASISSLANNRSTNGTGGTSFERILVNAPIVQSRAQGLFKGFVIADFAAFRIGSLQFEFDPVFKDVPLITLTGLNNSIEVKK